MRSLRISVMGRVTRAMRRDQFGNGWRRITRKGRKVVGPERAAIEERLRAEGVLPARTEETKNAVGT
jgi:hypothetical protein